MAIFLKFMAIIAKIKPFIPPTIVSLPIILISRISGTFKNHRLISGSLDGDGATIDHGGVDCNDSDGLINTAATETWYDNIDSDCAGDDDNDADGDGFVAVFFQANQKMVQQGWVAKRTFSIGAKTGIHLQNTQVNAQLDLLDAIITSEATSVDPANTVIP